MQERLTNPATLPGVGSKLRNHALQKRRQLQKPHPAAPHQMDAVVREPALQCVPRRATKSKIIGPKVIALWKEGKSTLRICRELAIGYGTVLRVLKEHNLTVAFPWRWWGRSSRHLCEDTVKQVKVGIDSATIIQQWTKLELSRTIGDFRSDLS